MVHTGNHMSSDHFSSDCWLFVAHKDALGKRFGSNEEVRAATEAYFEAIDKSFYKQGIKKLEKCWNDCNTLEGDFDDE